MSLAVLSGNAESSSGTASVTVLPFGAALSESGSVSSAECRGIEGMSESGRVSAGGERRGIEGISVICTISVRGTMLSTAYATTLVKTMREMAAAYSVFLDQIGYVTIVHDTLMVSPGASVTALMVDSAIISEPAAEVEPSPPPRARPLTVIELPLMFVSTGVVSVNWHVPDEGAVPSFIIEQTVASVVLTKLLVVS